MSIINLTARRHAIPQTEDALRRRLRFQHLAQMAAERAHGVRIRPIDDDAIRALGQGGPERQMGVITEQDTAALCAYLPDLMAELLEHRHAARNRAAAAVAALPGNAQ